jgi:hypothetical protein
MYVALVIQHFLPPISGIGARVFLMPLIMFYGAVALPVWGMLLLTFAGGLMWDLLHVQIIDAAVEHVGKSPGQEIEIGVGWSIVLYSILGALMSGFRPWFLRGRWEIHCLLCGIGTSVIVLAEYLMLSIRRLPVTIYFDKAIWWRIGGAGIAAAFLAPELPRLFGRLRSASALG